MLRVQIYGNKDKPSHQTGNNSMKKIYPKNNYQRGRGENKQNNWRGSRGESSECINQSIDNQQDDNEKKQTDTKYSYYTYPRHSSNNNNNYMGVKYNYRQYYEHKDSMHSPYKRYFDGRQDKSDHRLNDSKNSLTTFDSNNVYRTNYGQIDSGLKNFSFEKKNSNNLSYEVLDENLFSLDKDFALAHCVAEDLHMGAGIAVEFKCLFGGVGDLFDQNLKVGDVGVLNRDGQYLFYLITKQFSNGKPTMSTLKITLVSLLKKMKELELKKHGIPTIGCGLDRLNWSEVESCIMDLFAGSGIHISVCVPSPLKLMTNHEKTSPLTIYTTPENLWELQTQTNILLFINIKHMTKNKWNYKIDAKYPCL